MPKVDKAGIPQSDDPEGSDELRGGKVVGDPALDNASANGTGAGATGKEYDSGPGPLPGEKSSVS